MSLHGRGDLREPGTLSLKGLAHALGSLVVALGLSLGEGTLKLSDLLFELTDHTGRAGACLRVGAAPFLLLSVTDRGLNGTQAALDAV